MSGEISTQRLAIEDGAVLRGKVETGRAVEKSEDRNAVSAGKSNGATVPAGTDDLRHDPIEQVWHRTGQQPAGSYAPGEAWRHDAAGTKTHGGHGTTSMPAAVGATRAPAVGVESTRVSNGLKELMWNLDGLGRGTLLDMGGAWQATLSFFIEKGFRVTTDDLLRALEDVPRQRRERISRA